METCFFELFRFLIFIFVFFMLNIGKIDHFSRFKKKFQNFDFFHLFCLGGARQKNRKFSKSADFDKNMFFRGFMGRKTRISSLKRVEKFLSSLFSLFISLFIGIWQIRFKTPNGSKFVGKIIFRISFFCFSAIFCNEVLCRWSQNLKIFY